ncbi:MAG: SufD family Fe-S cluster assembly protein [Candidatus Kerfeldbacteria bacterium]|nr:SufD family Fe-S cluster assembly protein [Candidatus Kerfeldbacteria bacterium]
MQTLLSSQLSSNTRITENCALILDNYNLLNITVAPQCVVSIIILTKTHAPSEYTLSLTLEDGARVTMWSATFASLALKMTTHLVGNDSVFEHHALYVGKEKMQITEHLRCVHTGQHTMSRTVVHGLALDQAQIDVKGMIDIALSGHKADTHFGHEGLLLSARARIDAEPGLQIKTNDVKATHSSAVHFIRPEQLFYLQTRSLDEQSGKRMIAEGFLESALPRIPLDDMREQISQLIQSSIEHI